MTEQELKDAGFKRFAPPPHLDTCDWMYQKCIQDEVGKRYFINVRMWDNRKYSHAVERVSFGVYIQYKNGFTWDSNATVNVELLSCTKMAPADVLEWADVMWNKLTPNYYEKTIQGE